MVNWFRRLLTYITPTSLAGKAAVTALALEIALISGSVTYFVLGGDNNWKQVRENLAKPIIPILSVLIPSLVYIGVRINGGEEVSLYPDIDEAWKAGIDALSQVGLAPASGTVPFFLVLGGGDVEEAFAESMRAGGETFRLRAVPSAGNTAPALRWYATDSAIYVFCATVGSVGRLVEMWTSPERLLAQHWGPSMSSGELGSASRSAGGRHRILVSVSPDEIQPGRSSEPSAGLLLASGEGAAGALPTNINHTDEAARLMYLCHKIKRARRPRCGINGVIALLPFELSNANKTEIGTLSNSLQKDIHVIHRTLKLRFPITGLVVGAEEAIGFNEFARLLGTPYILQRLGTGFDVYRRVTAERLQILSDRICDSFEVFVYALFGRPQSLGEAAANRKLYRLLCQMRRQVKPKLCQLLTGAFGYVDRQHVANSINNGDEPPAYFSGCYLASTGNQIDQQAFVKGVFFDKLVLEQGKVEWTYEARRRQFQFKVAVFVGWTVAAALAILLLLQ